MGNGNFVGMFVHYFSWAWKEFFFRCYISWVWKAIVFLWVGYMFGSFSDEFMEMKDFWVDWNIVGCFRI